MTTAKQAEQPATAHDYVENDLMPRADWTEENLEIYRQRIEQEDGIREDCLGGAPNG